MKRLIVLLSISLTVFLSSCLESYLDKSPESGLTTEDVFTKYDNFKKFFNAVYDGRQLDNTTWRDYNIKCAYPLYFNFWDQKYTWEGMTDCADMGRYMEGQTFKSGQVSAFVNKFTYDRARRPILGSMFVAIRTSNIALANIKMLQADQADIDDLIAQAHFVRAFAHFELFRIWGPMPYITKALGPDDQWDVKRLSKYETCAAIAADMDTAVTYYAKANRMRRDNPVPGGAGHLTHADQARPNGVAAKAYKARALLYGASPLNNDKGQKAWEDAAKANWEAIETAKQFGYELLTLAKYKDNMIGVNYTNEQLWGWSAGTQAYNAGNIQGFLNGVFAGAKTGNSGECPTQNFVDKFETKWGEPLNTPAERDAAVAANHYNEQDPYKDRDPRFYIDIIYNQASNILGWTNAKAQIYYEMKNGAAVYSQLLDQTYAGISRTGYYTRKNWGEQSVNNKVSPIYTMSLIRLGELYLNYAEAVNEAYGPNGTAPGADLTAVQAVNIIRARVGQPDVLAKYTGSKDDFRPRIQNERNIELSFEGHYYFDIRRWKTAPAAYAGPLMGMDIEKVPVSATYPLGFKHTRVPLSADRQSNWKDAMYYLPFNTEDTYKMKNFVSNEVW
ncbi:MAG: RagB/SusD family nutrient uptake outer membrane protein [Prolixibacteraceae bacterium]|nr:RagB/SusD family nutrient uptake outer membrane protein [Prolixibacteraceae bacterium]